MDKKDDIIAKLKRFEVVTYIENILTNNLAKHILNENKKINTVQLLCIMFIELQGVPHQIGSLLAKN